MPAPEPAANQIRSPVRAGQIVDRKYRVEGVLGAGGMGIVVSAMHLALEEPVALKFMTAEGGKGDATARSRFLREAKAARKLTSAHVARVFDVGQLPTGEPYIVMELLRGDDLARRLRTQGRLSTGDTVRYMLQVCDAMREAHALGIIHRDLKPQNLFLMDRPGSVPIIKVLDFGIAKSLPLADADGAALTSSQSVVGSPVYMSPEQLRASKTIDARTDIWSIGIIMFELLSGKVPFVGDSVLELGMRIMTVPAPSLVALRDEVPAELADVVQRCLEKEPEKRFATIDELVRALKPFADVVSRRSLPFAETMGSTPPPALDAVTRTDGEFARTKSHGPLTRAGGTPAWTWGLLLLLPIAIVAVTTLRHRDPPAASAPTFHVELRVSPPNATVRLDTEAPTPGPFVRDLSRDGRAHTLAVEAPGFEPMELSFHDVAPPGEVNLKPLPQATVTAPPTSSSALLAEVPKAPPATPAPARVVTRPPTIPPAIPPHAPVVPSAVPTTTNDSPIVR